MARRMLFSAIAVVWLAVWTAQATVLQVPSDPYPTIAAACMAAGVGDTVAVAPGTYYESVTVPDGICVRGTGGQPGAVAVRGGLSWTMRVVGGPHGVLVENLKLIINYEYGFYVLENHNDHLEIRNCWLDAYGIPDAWCVIQTFSDVVLRNCLVEIPPSSWTRRNPIHPEAGVDILAEDCLWGGEGIDWGMEVPAGTSFVFKNNTFFGGVVVMPDEGQTDFSMYFINCIDWYSRCWGGEVPDTLEWRYCDFYNTMYPHPDCGTLVNCFSADPLFCDRQHGDFRLEWGSPCMGAGEGGEDVGARLGYCNVPEAVDGERSVRGSHLWASNPWPNPTTGKAELLLRGQPGVPVDVRIVGSDGALVRALTRESSGALQRLTWDGLRGDGRTAPAGVYYLLIESGGESRGRRLIVVR